MAFISLICMMWTEVYKELALLGKVLFAPMFAVVSVAAVALAIPTFFVIDIWCILLCLLMKDGTVSDYFRFWLF
jgi:hypothetical protein